MDGPMRVGVIGCGAISAVYLRNMTGFASLDVVSVADRDPDAAEARARAHGLAARAPGELLASPDVELVVNLTTPDAHAPIARRAVESGKHVYNEKPLTIDPADARDLLALADRHAVRVGAAPDTVLGAGIQTARRVLDQGVLGAIAGGFCSMVYAGPESWHPNPEFYYKPGAGPLFDMGPYYLSALVTLLGPVARVSGMARRTRPMRTITSEPRRGQVIAVETPTHYALSLAFASGAVVSMIMSFDVHASRMPRIELWGVDGALAVPDPNRFDGRVEHAEPGGEPAEVPLDDHYGADSRGIGVADMAQAIRAGEPHRANARVALHVLDVMHAAHLAADQGRAVDVDASCERPAPMTPGWRA